MSDATTATAAATAATLFKASGPVYVERHGTRLTLNEGDSVLSTDTLITEHNSSAEVRFVDGSTATLSPGTSLEVKAFAFGEGVEPSFILNLVQGTMRSVSGEVVKQNPDAFKIVTPQATVGIRGTELFTAVQPDGQEVHAVLHIGKDHIVVITGNDGQSMVMDQALQAVNMQGGAVGSTMVKHTYKLTEMQQVIDSIAPSQNQQPIRPQGPQGPQGPQAPQTELNAEGQQAAEADAAKAAPQAASQSSTVVIIYEMETAGSVQEAVTSTDVGTLISVVEHLQGTLADAGFSVQVADTGNMGADLGSADLPLVAGIANAGNIGDVVSQIIMPPTNLPAGPGTPSTPETPPSPVTPPTQYHVYDNYTSTDWANHLANVDPNAPQHVTINNLTGKLEANADHVTSGNTTSDYITVTAINGGSIVGDARYVAASGDVQLGNDTINFTSMNGGNITGDVYQVGASAGATVRLGNDVIIGDSISGAAQVRGDNSDHLPGVLGGTVIYGNDTITINSMSGKSEIYGESAPGQMPAGSTYEGGHDSITVGTMNGDDMGIPTTPTMIDAGIGNDVVKVTTMKGDAVIYGRDGNDSITVGTMEGGGGKIYGDAGNDVIRITSMQSGIVDGGKGNDVIHITTMQGGTVHAGAGQDDITVLNFDGGSINLSTGAAGGAGNRVYNRGDYSGGVFTAWFDGGTVVHLSGDLVDAAVGRSDGTADSIMRQLTGSFTGVTI